MAKSKKSKPTNREKSRLRTRNRVVGMPKEQPVNKSSSKGKPK